ncbi:hypothetical protein ACHAAC_02565 [Aeromicrobium sp. CF4.19]|uniref:hypothetical protein n=1 Tax=Aeromicrobium sp. CF4.19 TaxID=3373082 RepID=UPI003EE60C0E
MSPWDRLLDRLDALSHAGTPFPDGVEEELAELLVGAMRDGMADRELDPADSARWLVVLLGTHATLQRAQEQPDGALSTLRVIVTRWLHPGRLDQTARSFDAAL